MDEFLKDELAGILDSLLEKTQGLRAPGSPWPPDRGSMVLCPRNMFVDVNFILKVRPFSLSTYTFRKH